MQRVFSVERRTLNFLVLVLVSGRFFVLVTLHGGVFLGTLTDASRQRNEYYVRTLRSNWVFVGTECKLVVLLKCFEVACYRYSLYLFTTSAELVVRILLRRICVIVGKKCKSCPRVVNPSAGQGSRGVQRGTQISMGMFVRPRSFLNKKKLYPYAR